jgi:hypothetical protein
MADMRARDRRLRRRVVGLAAVAVVATGCAWTRPGFDPGGTGFNPTEVVVNPMTVNHLRP